MKKFTSALLALLMVSSSNCFATNMNKPKEIKSKFVNFVSSHPVLTTTGFLAAITPVCILSYKLLKNHKSPNKADGIGSKKSNSEPNTVTYITGLSEAKINILDNGDVTTAPSSLKFLKGKKVAIVNAANSLLTNGNGVCGSIFNATTNNGKDLKEALAGVRTVQTLVEDDKEYHVKCKPGQAVTTDAFGIKNVSKIIHTVAPNLSETEWPGNHFTSGWNAETSKLLKDCYINSLTEADKNKCDTVIFPSLGTGIYGCPMDKAINCVKDGIREYYRHNRNSNVKNIVFALRDEATNKYINAFEVVSQGSHA